jgi:hypothetical protein
VLSPSTRQCSARWSHKNSTSLLTLVSRD